MTRAETLRQISKEMPGICFVLSDGKVLQASEVLSLYDTLNAEVKEEDPKKPKQKLKPKADLDVGKMVALFNAGWKYKDIADEMGCAVSTVFNKIKEATGVIELDVNDVMKLR